MRVRISLGVPKLIDCISYGKDHGAELYAHSDTIPNPKASS